MAKSAELTQAGLVKTILARSGIDGSGAVFGTGSGPVEMARPSPIVMTAYEIQDDWPDELRSASQVQTEVRQFEKLSLAARLAMAGDRKARRIAKGLRVNLDGFPVVEAEALEAAIAEAAILVDEEARSADARTLADRHRARTGLILRGLRIRGRFSLYNGDIPFPIRLIGCVVEEAIVADHCRLRSLDLSGSAIVGLSATFLRADGNVRLRRTVSVGPIDLGGAAIRGVLDFSDAVVFPFASPPKGSAFTGDRGVLNLSLATVENEFRLNRVRIYGGLTMKGATIHRSMFMEDAMICSPIATVTRMALRWLIDGDDGAGTGRNFDPGPVRGLPELIAAERSLPHVADLLHAGHPRRRAAEVHGFPLRAQDPRKQALLFRLLAESTRARTTAVRADGLTVHGSIFARRLVSRGRFRTRYARIKGSLNLKGANLRSPRDSFDALAVLQNAYEPRVKVFWKLANKSRWRAQARERGEGDSYAIDIRDSKIEGSFDLGPMVTEDETQTKREQRTVVHGSIVANQSEIGAGFDLTAVIFQRSERAPPVASLEAKHAHVGCDLTLVRAAGVVGLEASYARIDGSIYMHGPLQNVNGAGAANLDDAVARCDISGRLNMRSMVVGGDADLLFGVKTLEHPPRPPIALNLRYSTFGGGLSIYPTRLQKPGGAATSAGDTTPRPGPEAALTGDDPGTTVHLTKDEFRTLLETAGLRGREAGLVRRRRRLLAFLRSYLPPTMESRALPPPPDSYIDMRNANAKVLRHPPSAWPERDGLLVTQLKYETSGSHGPLGVWIEAEGEPGGDGKAIRSQWALAAGALLFGVAGFVYLLWAEASGDVHTRTIDIVGRVNLGMLWLLFWLVMALRRTRRRITPTHGQLKPMGAFWLSLQRRRLNPFRTRGYYLPTEPYLVAANALRADGKLRSAELIELDRARMRRDTLSARHHTLARAGLQFLDYVAQYGFNISRTVLAAILLILLFSCVFEGARHFDYIRRTGRPDLTPPFRSVSFAADLVIPIAGTGESRQWVVVIPDRPPPIVRDRSPWTPQEAWRAMWREVCRSAGALVWLARVLGLLLTAIIGASLAARAESFLSRIQQ